MLLTAGLVMLGLALFALLTFALGTWATVRHTSQPPATVPGSALPPVTILKPVKGLEEALEANLRTFYEQDYPSEIEIVVASTERDDPALDVARAVAADYPAIRTRFVLSDPTSGLNPKVANLRGALAAATHDLVLQCDANVRVRRDYLRRVVSELVASDGSLLTSMVVGVGEDSAGAAMENLQLSAFIAPAMCFALRFFDVTCVVGKSMLFRRGELAELGGLDVVKDILAEDYVLGDLYTRAGKKALLSSTTAENVNVHVSVDRFMSRHARWLKMRVVIHIPAFVADLLANPVALATFATLLSGFDWRIASANIAIAAVKMAGDGWLVRRTRGTPMRLRHLLLAPVKDVLMGAMWPYAAISRSVEWRGARLRIGKMSRLRADNGALPVRVVRRMLAPFRA